MKLTKPALVACVAAVGLLTTACGQGVLGGGGDDADDKGPILLGSAIPMSGSSAAFGPYLKNGAQLAIDEINAKGGVLGRKLKLKVEDAACDPKTAVSAANKLVAAEVSASVGGYCSGSTLPTLKVFERKNIPMVIPAANSNELLEGHLKNVFLINGTGSQQADAAVKWMTEQDATKVALMDDNTSYSKDIATRTRTALKKPGGPDPVIHESITPGESDYSANVTNVLKKKPDFIYWTGYYQEGGLLIRQFEQAGYSGEFMVADGSVDSSLAKIAEKKNADGVYATMTQTPDTIQGAGQWKADYKKKFGSKPGPFSPQAYDAVRVAAQGIKKAGSTDPDKVIKALEGIDGFKIFSGPLKFTPKHTLTNGGFVILKMKNGEFELKSRLK